MATGEMNCLEFRRAALADPRRLSAPARAHGAGCAACAAFARDVEEAERDLERTLAVAVPDGLADRVLLRARGERAAWKGWALAAGIVLAAATGFAWIFPTASGDRFARLAIEHVAEEPEALTKVHDAAPHMLQELLARAGGTLKAPLGTIRYVKLCPVDGGVGWHIVLETPEGLATLFIVHGQPLAAMQSASAGGWSALARPVRTGYYAVVTPSADATARVERLVNERIDWKT